VSGARRWWRPDQRHHTTIDMKRIEDLPLADRNVAQLSQLTAGYNGT
jgi:hypothetical protein